MFWSKRPPKENRPMERLILPVLGGIDPKIRIVLKEMAAVGDSEARINRFRSKILFAQWGQAAEILQKELDRINRKWGF